MDNPDTDPRPQRPEKPLPMDCCDSGCECCVMDVYADELEDYGVRLKAWQQRHPDADQTSPQRASNA